MNADDVLRPVVIVLTACCNQQKPAAQEARRSGQPEMPGPATENPMLAYLLGNAKLLIETDGHYAALLWLATHAWFEGGLDAIDRTSDADCSA
jgi:hypothetical protein